MKPSRANTAFDDGARGVPARSNSHMAPFALTLIFSPREKEQSAEGAEPASCDSNEQPLNPTTTEFYNRERQLLPLPGGEGRGEGQTSTSCSIMKAGRNGEAGAPLNLSVFTSSEVDYYLLIGQSCS